MTAAPPSWLRPAVDYGPLLAFFVAYFSAGLMVATAVLIAVTLVALGAALWFERRLPVMPLVTAVVVAVFGGLTLWLDDDSFIKMKPTIVQVLFAVVLLGGVAVGRSPIKPLLAHAFPTMPDPAWRTLSLRFAAFFLVMAAANEVVWRTQSTGVWVTFKVFGLMGLTLAFTMAQMPFLLRHGGSPATGDSAGGDPPEESS